MKNINSPSRIIALLGLSACVHGAVLWAVNEKVSLSALPEMPRLMWSDSQTAPVASTPIEEPWVEKTEEPIVEKVVEKPKIKKTLAKKTIVSQDIATELPAKNVQTESKSLNSQEELPKTTVAEIIEPEVKLIPVRDAIDGIQSADLDEKTEAGLSEAPLETEVAQAETAMGALNDAQAPAIEEGPVRSYQSLRQMSGNQPPQYPLQARRLGQSGRVDLRYFVTDSGDVKDVLIESSSGSELLDKEAIRAVSGFKFFPGQAGWTKHPVKFSLRGQDIEPARLRTSGSSKP